MLNGIKAFLATSVSIGFCYLTGILGFYFCLGAKFCPDGLVHLLGFYF